MKRPVGYACLIFILFVRLFYVCFPPTFPDYSAWKGREVYVRGRVISMWQQEYNGALQTIYVLEKAYLQETGADNNLYFSDKNNSVYNTRDNSGTFYVHNIIRCYSSQMYSQINIGSVVWMQGTFMPYESAQNPGQFDAQFYYHIQDIGASLQNVKLVWTDGNVNIWEQFLFDLKNYFRHKADTLFEPETGGVVKAIVLGDKDDLDKELKNLYKESGILHILTISGLHISMFGYGCFKLLRKMRCPIQISALIGLLVVLFYGALIGVQATTFRAVCMFFMQMSALLLGRTYDRLTGILMAAVLLVLDQPMYVFYAGFLLSFAAVLGITIITPMVERIGKEKGPVIAKLAKWLSASFGIFLATFPIQLYFYYEYPLYSVLVNLIILPFMPYVLALGVTVLLIPLQWSLLSMPIVFICQWLLYGYQWICTQSQNLPWHCIVLGAPKPWQIIWYYVCLALWLVYLKWTKKDKKIWKQVMFALFLGAMILLLWRPVEGLTCHFFSVGQGDCALIRFGKENYLVDGGSTSKLNMGTQILLPCLKYYGISKVDGVFISHADADHMNGIMQWLNNYKHSHVQIGRIILPALEEEALQAEFESLILLANTLEIPITTLGAGDRLQIGEMAICVLHPTKYNKEIENSNEYSQVLLFTYKGKGILMTGDIGTKQEQEILATQKLLETTHIVAFKAPHHGSKYSSSQEFLQAIVPENTILSYGLGNSYGHPHEATIERLEKVDTDIYRTAKSGMITVKIAEEKAKVETWRSIGKDFR